MKRVNRQQESGIALIMVLMVVAVLITIAGGFSISMKVETTLARNASWDTELEWMGRSGIEIAKWALSQSKNAREDYLGQAWAGGHSPGEENAEVDALIGQWITPVGGGGRYRIEIEDMDRKFNLNSPQVNQDRMLMESALNFIGLDASVIPTMVGSIKDWIDPDNLVSPSGAESEFYEKFDPPYRAKNGMMDDISELLYVNGVRDNPNAFWGSGAPSARRHTKSARQSVFEEQQYENGLRDLFSAWPMGGGTATPGLLNINTASVAAMMAIPGMVEGIANEIVQARQSPNGDIVPVPPQAVIRDPQMLRFFKSQSSAFQVKVVAEAGKNSRTFIGRLLRRGPKQFQLVDFAIQEL